MSAAHRAASHSSSDQRRSSTATPPVPLHVVAGRLGDDRQDDPRRRTPTYCRTATRWPRKRSPPRSLTSR